MIYIHAAVDNLDELQFIMDMLARYDALSIPQGIEKESIEIDRYRFLFLYNLDAIERVDIYEK